MLLRDWLSERELKPADLAPHIGVSAEAVRRYSAGTRIPGRAEMAAIARHTDCRVTANDFFGIECCGDHAPSATADRDASETGKISDRAGASAEAR